MAIDAEVVTGAAAASVLPRRSSATAHSHPLTVCMRARVRRRAVVSRAGGGHLLCGRADRHPARHGGADAGRGGGELQGAPTVRARGRA
eukprot:2637292-Prymnesium_polylepis.1